MQISKRYYLTDVDQNSHRSSLGKDNKVKVVVDGLRLEAQLEMANERTLLWLTEDCPFEEALHIYLLDKGGAILDAIEAGSAYSPGILKLGAMGENWVSFKFYLNEKQYKLEISTHPRLRWLLQLGWRFKKLLRAHYLTVREAPTLDEDMTPLLGPR